MSKISIPDAGLELHAEPGDNLLKVLRRNQAPVRYSCKRGECGSCKCRVLAGEVELEEHAAAALTPAQREAGLILACRSRIRGDLVLGLVDSDDFIVHPERRVVTAVEAVEELVPGTFLLRLRIRYVDRDGEPFVFSAGQYARLGVHCGDELLARDFSIASTPVDAEYDDVLEFHIRRTAGGAFSGLLGGIIRPGATVYVEGPMGSGHFRPRHAGPLFAVSAGTGLAPMLSIVRTALLNGKTEDVVLYAGFRDAAEVYGRDELAALASEYPNFRYCVVVESGAGGRPGRVGDALLADVPDFAGAKVYLAGSPAMVEAVSAALRLRGVQEADIHADAYYVSRQPAPVPAA